MFCYKKRNHLTVNMQIETIYFWKEDKNIWNANAAVVSSKRDELASSPHVLWLFPPEYPIPCACCPVDEIENKGQQFCWVIPLLPPNRCHPHARGEPLSPASLFSYMGDEETPTTAC